MSSPAHKPTQNPQNHSKTEWGEYANAGQQQQQQQNTTPASSTNSSWVQF